MTPAEEENVSPLRKWIIAMTVMFGAFLAVMDISVVNVALPHMMGTFGQDLSAITWVATSYTIAEIIMLTMAGWLSTLLGRKRLFLLSFVVFTGGSMLCGTAAVLPQMILFYRVIQGIGGGSLIPCRRPSCARPSRPGAGHGHGVYGMGVVLAPAIGPDRRRLADRPLRLAVDLLHQRSLRASSACCSSALFVQDPPYLRRGVPQDRLAGHRPAHRRPHRPCRWCWNAARRRTGSSPT